MPAQARAETIAFGGGRIVLRRVEGPVAREIFLLGEPAGADSDAGAQAAAIFAGIDACLAAEGAMWSDVRRETIFLASVARDLDAIRAARRAVVGASLTLSFEVEQPPLIEGKRLLVGMHVTVPKSRAEAPARSTVRIEGPCDCAECAVTRAVRRSTGSGSRLDCAGVFGVGENALAQTRSAFERAEALLGQAGMSFDDVVRTWIHLREIDRDYDALNQGRRAFFSDRGIDPPPASTGIGGTPAAAAHDLSLGFEALRREGNRAPSVMHASTLNEAPEYGADFVRGLRVDEENGTTLHVSGTASVDEAGRTAHVGDFDAQAKRMLVNVRTLLEGQGADFAHIVSAITYVKRRADTDRLRAALSAAGFEGFPHALVEAPVCRPELLCETEAIALLPSVPD